ncbi:surface antigen BspA-like [Trichomonas vaginalis G3]|uniref:Surface antigen BspA-like n=1 Tax=Trichomonas vaginalis (strain ATCC PRA-98 / G3) TaxID=412133 RepID=A2DJQ4_TRIV3|nr:surface antigen BspA-like [Trichomonas vaginalis G3]|eukprot:XP_001580440.1 surface antigen BspA-like [Trichomonas vaginalis G3]
MNVPKYLCYYCSQLTSIKISNLDSIGEYAFAFCSNIVSINFNFKSNSQIQFRFFSFYYCGSFDIEISTIGVTFESYSFAYSKIKSLTIVTTTNGISFGSNCFYRCSSLTRVSAESETPIETTYNGLFFTECMKLTEVLITNLEVVQPKSFKNCISLRTVNIPQANTFKEYAFFNCKELEEITINQADLILDKYCFSRCSKLKTFPIDRIKTISEGAFCLCSSLTVGNDIVLTGKQSTFSGCNSLIDIKFKIQADSYKQDASIFEDCIGLTTVTFVSGGKSVVSPFMFKGCTSLTTVNFDDSITSIYDYAFENTLLTNLDLKNVYYISKKAFLNSKIETLTFNKQMTIDKTAFLGCTNLKLIKLQNDANIYNKDIFKDSPNVRIISSDSSLPPTGDTLIEFTNEDTAYNIPSSIKKIEKYAFKSSKVKTITCDHKIDFEWGFAEAKTLEEVVFTTKEIIEIASFAFCNCTNLKKVLLEPETYIIGDYAFYNCQSLSEINLSKFNSFGASSFENCFSLKSIRFMDLKEGKNVFIYDRAFYNCNKLIKVRFPDYGVQINQYCFAYTGIIAIEKIILDFDKGIGAFSHAYDLVYIKISFDLTTYSRSIPKYAFEYTSLLSFDIPYFQKIEAYAFSHINKSTYFVFTYDFYYDFIDPTAFYGSFNIKFDQKCRDGVILSIITIGEHEIAYDSILILTYGKMPSTYVIPSFITVVLPNAIQSCPIYSEDGKILDYGVTTLVIPHNIEFVTYNYYQPWRESSSTNFPIYDTLPLYLQNICFGGYYQSSNFDSPLLKNIYVTNNFTSSFWFKREKFIPVIKGECDSSTSFEDYAKGDYYAPTKKSTEYGQLTPSKKIDRVCIFEVPIPDIPSFLFSDDDEITENPQPSDNDENTNTTTTTTTTTNAFPFEIGEPNESSSLSLLIIILIAVAIVEVILILSLIILIVIKQKESEDSESTFEFNQEQIDTLLSGTTSVTITTALFNTQISDDSFAKDFEDDEETYLLASGLIGKLGSTHSILSRLIGIDFNTLRIGMILGEMKI